VKGSKNSSTSWRVFAPPAAARGIANRASTPSKPYLLEETYEVMDAIDATRLGFGTRRRAGRSAVAAVFFRADGRAKNKFDIADSLNAINES
jgi:uncharacterized protein YabN with tetrapyrrole methylase and pyrophosphatase domain